MKKINHLAFMHLILVLLLGCCLIPLPLAAQTPSRDIAVEVNEEGKLAVIDQTTGAVLHVLPKPEGVIREMHALDGGAMVLTTKRDRTDIRNAETGELVRQLDFRVYAVDHSEQLGVVFTDSKELKVLDWPELSVKWMLETGVNGGPSQMAFSPDDRYLAVEFCNAYPLSDEMFVNPGLNAVFYWTRLYDMQTGEMVPEFTESLLGSFEDVRHYRSGDENRRFDLQSHKWTGISNEERRR